jgi:death-on-curing protein
VHQIVRINRIQLELKGGLPFVPPFNYRPDGPTLDLILDTISEPVFGTEFYLGVCNKAAALAWKITSEHVFNDANKRTGMHAGIALVRINQHRVYASTAEIIDVAVLVGTGQCTAEELGVWFFKHIE